MLELLDRIDRRTLLYMRRVALIGVTGILLIGAGTIVDVLSRFLFNAPLTGFNEIIEVGMAVAIAATFPGGASGRVNIRMDLLAARIGPVSKARLECASAMFLFVFYVFLTWQLAQHSADLQERGAATVFLEWRKAPFMWAVAVAIGVCACAQFIVFLVSVRDMLETAREHGASALGAASARVAAALTDGTFYLWALGVLVLTVLVVYGLEQGILSFSRTAQSAPPTIGIVLFFVMWFLSLMLIPIGVSMAFAGVVGAGLLMGIPQALNVLGTEAASYLTNDQLAVLPMFLLMGSFASAAGLSRDIYDLAFAFFGHLRGGLALATIGGCAGFGALTGSSVATAATIGQAALPEMRGRGYSAELATGSVAAGGTLGQLVPPSTALVLYAILTEESIGRLFIAAVIPAVIAVILYMATIAIVVRVFPNAAPVTTERAQIAEMARAVRKAWGVLALVGLVLGGIYGGVFTVNEAASVGAVGAFLFALFRGKLGGGNAWRVMGEVTRTTAMIYNLIFGAVTFSFFIGISGLPDFLTTTINAMELSPLGVICVLLIIFLALGTVMDSFPVMVITIPIVTPMITHIGYDLVWWGIINVCVVETGAITPPFGINIFILKGIQGGDVPMGTVYRGVLPFCIADMIKLALLVLFPVLALWLPSTMFT
ncbi:MAG TPA: TRAP transporter large permease subunit [Alphaproteobacteria bacterium]